jgi:hypothetical protein
MFFSWLSINPIFADAHYGRAATLTRRREPTMAPKLQISTIAVLCQGGTIPHKLITDAPLGVGFGRSPMHPWGLALGGFSTYFYLRSKALAFRSLFNISTSLV